MLSAANEIISYNEMCTRESTSLQRGMNFLLGHDYSVILMSLRRNAPYRDRLEDDGATLIYEGHDEAKGKGLPNPKKLDQPEKYPSGSLTENGKFYHAAQEYKGGRTPPHGVRVYEKIHTGIWSYNGLFHLVDAWRERSHGRTVFKFKLIPVESEGVGTQEAQRQDQRRRLIPTRVKLQVWKRDKAQCVICHATDELHFDHVLPYSKGGTSITAENIQLLCARHNLAKSDKIL